MTDLPKCVYTLGLPYTKTAVFLRYLLTFTIHREAKGEVASQTILYMLTSTMIIYIQRLLVSLNAINGLSYASEGFAMRSRKY